MFIQVYVGSMDVEMLQHNVTDLWTFSLLGLKLELLDLISQLIVRLNLKMNS